MLDAGCSMLDTRCVQIVTWLAALGPAAREMMFDVGYSMLDARCRTWLTVT